MLEILRLRPQVNLVVSPPNHNPFHNILQDGGNSVKIGEFQVSDYYHFL